MYATIGTLTNPQGYMCIQMGRAYIRTDSCIFYLKMLESVLLWQVLGLKALFGQLWGHKKGGLFVKPPLRGL